MKVRKFIYKSVAITAIFAVTLECILRYLGYGDFPVYRADSQIGYIPIADQAGSFAGKYPWYFNEHSMRNQPFVADAERGVLLLGDSIVFGGGIDYMPEERLGACLQAAVGGRYRLWSAGAGSWAYLNEATYLERNPDVVAGVRWIIWVVNSGDWSLRSHWATDSTHPRVRPKWLSLYLVMKYLSPNISRIGIAHLGTIW